MLLARMKSGITQEHPKEIQAEQSLNAISLSTQQAIVYLLRNQKIYLEIGIKRVDD
jgi:hypothetical protein